MELFQICDVQTSQYLSSTCIIYNKNSAVQKNLIEMSAVYLTLEKKRTPEINERKQMRCNFFHHEVVFGMYAVNFSGAHVLI
jgi:hypothetical protein